MGAVHGDDLPKVRDGKGLFDELIDAGRLRIVKRTEGTSTTLLIGRLMSMSKEHIQKSDDICVASPRLVSAEAHTWSRSVSEITAEENRAQNRELSPEAAQ